MDGAKKAKCFYCGKLLSIRCNSILVCQNKTVLKEKDHTQINNTGHN